MMIGASAWIQLEQTLRSFCLVAVISIVRLIFGRCVRNHRCNFDNYKMFLHEPMFIHIVGNTIFTSTIWKEKKNDKKIIFYMKRVTMTFAHKSIKLQKYCQKKTVLLNGNASAHCVQRVYTLCQSMSQLFKFHMAVGQNWKQNKTNGILCTLFHLYHRIFVYLLLSILLFLPNIWRIYLSAQCTHKQTNEHILNHWMV